MSGMCNAGHFLYTRQEATPDGTVLMRMSFYTTSFSWPHRGQTFIETFTVTISTPAESHMWYVWPRWGHFIL